VGQNNYRSSKCLDNEKKQPPKVESSTEAISEIAAKGKFGTSIEGTDETFEA
jgi:hypothetical protein